MGIHLMARIRTVKPAFFRHRRLYDLERLTDLPVRVAFAGLWTVADREGRFKWDPDELKLDCLPYDPVDFSRVLDALRTRHFVLQYEVGGQKYGLIPGFRRHQVINNREAASDLPKPPDDIEELARQARVDDASGTQHNLFAGEGKGTGREGEGSSVAKATGAATPQPAAVETKPAEPYATPAFSPGLLDIPLSLIRPEDGDWSKPVWRQGLQWLAKKAGKSPDKLRGFMGRLVAMSGSDHQRLFKLIAQAETENIGEPQAWLTAHLGGKTAAEPLPVGPTQDTAYSRAVRAWNEAGRQGPAPKLDDHPGEAA